MAVTRRLIAVGNTEMAGLMVVGTIRLDNYWQTLGEAAYASAVLECLQMLQPLCRKALNLFNFISYRFFLRFSVLSI
ncbi:hypothetical protein QVD17_10229 [Tagetes erecta]|uniref:Uncharacterized protein n=1 Tax=Tagetes erecta TaxID=13708 RepID=A0AAD8L0P3_TARER|nr:hypothetical protein QVD17_10229 [Tagetes erecta]